jgi:hypothetical protein
MESQMSQDPEKRDLKPNDPVDTETLEQFRRLQEARSRFADSLLSLEQEKIQILAAVKKVDDQSARLFEHCLIERGLPPTAKVSIDPRTGAIDVVKDDSPKAQAG